MGAHPLDYARRTPPNSFIHVDWFQSPKELAAYLLELDRDDARYNRFFQWRSRWKALDPQFFCQLCFMTHFMRIEGIRMHYPNFESWWRNYNRWNETENLCIGSQRWVQPIAPSLLPA